jgi:hypothetical protein
VVSRWEENTVDQYQDSRICDRKVTEIPISPLRHVRIYVMKWPECRAPLEWATKGEVDLIDV